MREPAAYVTASTPLRRLYGSPLRRPPGLLSCLLLCMELTTCKAPLPLPLPRGRLPPLKIPQRLASVVPWLLGSDSGTLLVMSSAELQTHFLPLSPFSLVYA